MAGGRHRSTGGPNKGNFARRSENNRIYAHPLPLIFENPLPKHARSISHTLGLSLTRVINPHCEGYLDIATRSVWVVKSSDSRLLWGKGFWGKGDLSRSEPSWLARRIRDRKAGAKGLTSEEFREKRRVERRQFKIDRARAIAAVAAEAEAIFETEGRVVVPALSGPEIPSGATWKPSADFDSTQFLADRPIPPVEDNLIEDIEHLQLTLYEAFFLTWNLDCLSILDPDTDEALNLQQIWTTFQLCYLAPPIPYIPPLSIQFDNPFLVHYVAFHHYRSLGWVVKNGIKFCVDYLLYKRGPVFTHAEFAVVICPVYEDPEDQETSVTNLQNATPFGWSWLSTMNRVNSQVMKTLILSVLGQVFSERGGSAEIHSGSYERLRGRS
uniref:tRNA-splicing endonuclease subunit Sen2 n=1 Tax=Moniliophthora roreri TaxID=221103 RepID=A0A0W0F357_MONRR